MNSRAGGYGGGSRWSRVQQAFAHALPSVLVAGVAVRAATWFGWFVAVNQIVTLVLLISWVRSPQHRLQELKTDPCPHRFTRRRRVYGSVGSGCLHSQSVRRRRR